MRQGWNLDLARLVVGLVLGWQIATVEARLTSPRWLRVQQQNNATSTLSPHRTAGNPPDYPHSRYRFVTQDATQGTTQQPQNRKAAASNSKHHDVIIVGAGAAGLGAAHRLALSGVTNVVILEATSNLGGRMQVNKGFVSYPLDLGPSYLPGRWFIRELERLAGGVTLPITNPPGASFVWQDYSYNDYFTDHILSNDMDIRYNCVVESVDYRSNVENGAASRVECANGQVFWAASHVIVTASLKVLQDGDIKFSPPLENSLINHRDWWPGLKIFMEFPNKFYNNAFCPVAGSCYNNVGEELFWDGSVSAPNPDQVSNLVVGYVSGDRVQGISTQPNQVRNQLTRAFEQHFNLASGSLQANRYLLQDWRAQFFVKGLYSGPSDRANFGAAMVDDKVVLAGEAYPILGEEWGWVYSAFHSGFDAADQIFDSMVRQKPWVGLGSNGGLETFEGDWSSRPSLWNLPSPGFDATWVRAGVDTDASLYCPNGNCIRLQDDSLSQSSLFSDPIDVTLYTSVRLSYDFYMHQFETGEAFFVEMSLGASSSGWQILEAHYHDDGLILDNAQHDKHIVIDTRTMTGPLFFRFRSHASVNADRIYLDNIFVGFLMESNAPTASPTLTPTTESPTSHPTLVPTTSPSTTTPTMTPTTTPTLTPIDRPTMTPSWSSMPSESCSVACLESSSRDSCTMGCPACPSCESLVCQEDPYCCTEIWDRKCGDLAQQLCVP